ncbi:SDR family NAD(P)-dependent oxidoreductase [Hyphomicrobium facile]|uniref:NAD(P)-dependent dehydrogenase, short-chain alcohol dehydrogenase family n=1 Tax=Hyphomicrobium facile TaxID=51670 RepID=A0A1I7NFU4_9HYPH|nr:SDR family oxidoreductase [Hyphomicrobium facile]SFV33510.1 NAD(P)-dependent dehydrogenase, short-chain alcohol dehydrogenase family [Hyphomicrobium facile]
MAQVKSASGQKIAIVTGGSRGLGQNTVVSLAERGVDVIFTYRSNRAEAEKTVSEVEKRRRKAVALQLDAGNVASFDAFVAEVRKALKAEWGRDTFDYLVNNAGMGLIGSIAEMKEADFDELYNVHLKGVFFLTQKLLPLMADNGRIVNLSSGLARFTMPGFAAYAAMKGAIEVLTRFMAKEFGPRGIAVNVVAPGAIETDFGGGLVRDNADINKHIASVTALGRVGVPDDIGPMIALLLADENRWMTAQRLEVSGGTNL